MILKYLYLLALNNQLKNIGECCGITGGVNICSKEE